MAKGFKPVSLADGDIDELNKIAGEVHGDVGVLMKPPATVRYLIEFYKRTKGSETDGQAA